MYFTVFSSKQLNFFSFNFSCKWFTIKGQLWLDPLCNIYGISFGIIYLKLNTMSCTSTFTCGIFTCKMTRMNYFSKILIIIIGFFFVYITNFTLSPIFQLLLLLIVAYFFVEYEWYIICHITHFTQIIFLYLKILLIFIVKFLLQNITQFS